MRTLSKRIIMDTAGFTLVELLGVAVIVITLSLMGMQVYDVVSDRARMARGQDELRTIEIALERHRADYGHYPDRLMELVEAGYMKKGTTFESAWSKGLVSPPSRLSHARIYYFYAVDNTAGGQALAYALGDPGRNCRTDSQLHGDAAVPLPCGRIPSEAAYSFNRNADLHLVSSTSPEFVRGHLTLRQFRSNCKVTSGTASAPAGCDLKTES